ncbi:MAG: PEP-CTERM sorting domain-containing protein [Planctomycetaceae bacterium]|nr:PEP-CTERM sorting domain-containing protein [Planctomycetaceae bacterium]
MPTNGKDLGTRFRRSILDLELQAVIQTGLGYKDFSEIRFNFEVSGSGTGEEAIPEPTTMLIWSVLGGLGLLVWRRRSNQ